MFAFEIKKKIIDFLEFEIRIAYIWKYYPPEEALRILNF